ncbi:hypothetical protein GGR54DRAFT_635240 [Hypoxylon sp. NC1633]|nr:hypothetical protein GGR54DRAFT_635240 [Hypoxylon sp. NC1633]
MLMNPTLPPSVWPVRGGHQPGGSDFACESHLRINRDQEFFQFLCRRFVENCPCLICKTWADLVSQRQFLLTMDDQHLFQPMAVDSGDDDYMTEDFDYSHFPGTDASTSYARNQTTAAGVSVATVGRDFHPSHPQPDKGPAGIEQMLLPNIPTPNAYAGGYGANYDTRQFWQTYNTAGSGQAASYFDFPDGLPSQAHGLPTFGEPLGGIQVSPTSISSSDPPSSATSEAMVVYGNAAGGVRGHSSASASVSASDSFGSSWTPSYPSTISPQMLRINPSPTPASSSESVHTHMLAGAESDLGSSTREHRHTRTPFPSPRPAQKPRKELPSKPLKPRTAPVVPADSSSSKGKRPARVSQSGSIQQSPRKTRVAQLKQESQADASHGEEGSSSHKRGATKAAEGGRSAKDDFLVKSKMAGMTYKEIRRKGNFAEAESTLRGRFRTLTKDKEARVRKPEWLDNDIRLLKKAVRKLNRGNDPIQTKAPWGQVADYIKDHGGSYHFGGATCHKKWKELVDEGMVGPM